MFGVPVGTLAVVLAVLVALGVAIVAVLAARNVVFFRLGVRNIGRRAGRTVLIVVGLMLATTIIAAALGTGDAMGRAVRSSVLKTLGNGDEWITVKGAKPGLVGAEDSSGMQLFDQRAVVDVERALRGSGLVDGVTPAIIRTVAVQDQTSRQTEPRVTLFAPDATRLEGFGTITGSDGRAAELGSLAPGSVFINRDAATALGAHRGDTIAVLAGSRILPVRVADIVSYRGAGTAKSAMLIPLDHVQRALGTPGKVEEILVSNRGGETSGVGRTDAVVSRLRPALDRLELEAQPLKQDGLNAADQQGAVFVSMFTMFGSFSIAAGILLIFLIFVMLAAERRSEMGVARAIGTQRGHLVQTFLFEGAAYDLGAAALGVLLGIGVSFALVAGIGSSLASESGVDMVFSVKWPSAIVAYTLGVLFTFLVVVFSAWRVSVLNIVTAVRGLPDPPRRRGRRGWVVGAAIIAVGVLLAASGRSSAQAMPFLLGCSLVAVGVVPILRAFGVSDRAAYTFAGVAIDVLWLLPFRLVEGLVPGAQMDFSSWIVGGLMIVLGAVWIVMYNADALLHAMMKLLGRVRSFAAVLRISTAYPLRNRLRTGMTLAMFMLVVYTLVVGIATPSSFIAAQNNATNFGGGFDVRMMSAPASPITDMSAALRTAKGINAGDVRTVAAISSVPVKVRQSDATTTKLVDYPLRGLDLGFLANNHYALGSRANGYTSDRQVWEAVARGGNLAVVDPWIVAHRRNWNFGALTELKLTGLYAEDPTFAPVPVDVRDPVTGTTTRFTVVGVLRDTMPFEMAGISTSQRALHSFGDRARPTMYLFGLADGVDPSHFATQLESSFLANGVQADSFAKLVDDGVSASMVFLRLIEGFMLLGLIVGVAALGVIAARSVVERRQQIGVLRSIGFQAGTIRLGFLLESGFIALTSIVVGTALGLATAYNVVDDAHRQASWPGVQLVVPWMNLMLIFVVVMTVALATTYLPARRASRVYPAEALRYQ
jgi:putative ABC transport system permease protein